MEESGNNWDLQAVVRGYRVMAKDPFSSFLPLLPPAHKEEEVEVGGDAWCFPDLMMESKSGLEELEELYKPFLPKTQQPSPSSTTTAAAAVAVAPKLGPQPQQNRQPNRQVSQVPRSKRRKNQQKKVVCHVPADGVSSDMWAWRKYGQKPIKGSPYPRGYYRCSSSKGCLARKQVERSRTDPAMFIITYTAEHNHPVPTHRNSLAGSTRNKSQTPTTTTSGGAASASASGGDEENPPPRKAGLSPTTPLAASWRQKGEEGEEEDEADDEEEEEGMLLVEDMEVMGEDELLFMDGGGGGEEANGASSSATATIPAAAQVALSGFFDYEAGLEEPFFNPPWMANSNNTAAAAGGS